MKSHPLKIPPKIRLIDYRLRNEFQGYAVVCIYLQHFPLLVWIT